MIRACALVVVIVLAAACGGDDEGGDEGGGGDTTVASTTSAGDTAGTNTPETDTAGDDGGEAVDPDQQFPDVIGVEATSDGVTWTFSVTISSPYDTPERYADAWRVVGPDGTVYGERPLAHDHQYEQPFTRTLSGVEIPVGVDTVVVEGRDQHYGWGGGTFEYELPAG